MTDTLFTIITWSLATVSVIGAWLNAKQKRIGFIVWGLANVCWLFIDGYRGIYAQSALYCVFIGFNIYGWIQWSQKKTEEIVRNIFQPDPIEALYWCSCGGKFINAQHLEFSDNKDLPMETKRIYYQCVKCLEINQFK